MLGLLESCAGLVIVCALMSLTKCTDRMSGEESSLSKLPDTTSDEANSFLPIASYPPELTLPLYLQIEVNYFNRSTGIGEIIY